MLATFVMTQNETRWDNICQKEENKGHRITCDEKGKTRFIVILPHPS